MSTKRLLNTLPRDLYVLEDENDPRGSQINPIWPSTVLDQVYDQLTPGNKTLREIIEDLRVEISTGGRDPIKFPVTSVNGETGDIQITKDKLGMKLVDNTRDIDKPLSNPQRKAVENMLKSFDFKVDLSQLYDHLNDSDNPHHVTYEQLNKTGAITSHIQRLINDHKFSQEQSTHPDIRNSISQIWNLVDRVNEECDTRISSNVSKLESHLSDPIAHIELIEPKEDEDNKKDEIDKVKNRNDHESYPSIGAVIEYVEQEIKHYDDFKPEINQWIEGVEVVDREENLPEPSEKQIHMIYFIREGISSHDEIAICHRESNRYKWRITQLGSIYKFDSSYFIDTTNGMSLRLDKITDGIMAKKGPLVKTIDEMLTDYMPRSEYEGKGYLTDVKILPGLSNGSIRYVVNDDMRRMSPDVRVSGLQRLAFLEHITEEELQNQAVHGRHIIDNCIEKRHLKSMSVDAENIYCPTNKILGNINNSNSSAQYISVEDLANTMRPLITGEIDPDSKAGPTWKDILNKAILTQSLMEPEKEYSYTDGSFGMRFKGVITSLANMNYSKPLSDELTSKKCQFIDAGGSWQYSSKPDCWTTLGGSNITGHTFAAVLMTEKGLVLESITTGDRWEAEYDVWVRYMKR